MMSMHVHHETKLSKSCIYQLAYEICGPFLSRLAAAAQLMLLKPAFGCVWEWDTHKQIGLMGILMTIIGIGGVLFSDTHLHLET